MGEKSRSLRSRRSNPRKILDHAGGRRRNAIGPEELKEVCKFDVGMWSNINSEMVDWAHRLRESGLKVGLLSNMHSTMVTHCRKQFDWIKILIL